MHKKTILGIAGAAAALMLGAMPSAQANAWPDKPIRLVVPFAPGGVTDIVARLASNDLSKALGQPVVVDNRPGAAGNIGAEAVARAPADGYTLLMGTVGTQAINPSLYKKATFDATTAFAPITLIASVPNILVINPSLPVKSVSELVSYGKAHPDKLTFASSGAGTSIHLSGEMFKDSAGVQMTHVPYRGGALAVNDLVGGQVNLMFDNLPTSLPFVKSGKLKALAVTSAKRSPALPDVPTMMEAGIKNFESGSWFGVLAPAGTPAAIVNRLNAELQKIIARPEFIQKLHQNGAEPVAKGPAPFAQHIKAETAKWAAVVKAADVSLD
jgi:tripartite-type tricarboxylate transporter receptor subunit TctC